MRSERGVGFRSARTGRDFAPARSALQSIISVGRDPELLRLREQAILRQSSLSIRSMTPDEAAEWSGRPEPRLWIFCHTVEQPRLVNLACKVLRFSPESRLILLEGPQRIGFESSLFHLVVRPSDGVDGILEAVNSLSLTV
jgi:hypothetical protein